MKTTAAMVITWMRPMRSARRPAYQAPTAHPSSATDTTKPVCVGLREYCAWMPGTAPLITDESNPNRKPPSAATRETATTRPLPTAEGVLMAPMMALPAPPVAVFRATRRSGTAARGGPSGVSAPSGRGVVGILDLSSGSTTLRGSVRQPAVREDRLSPYASTSGAPLPVDPASLVALSGLAARDLPDDAALIGASRADAPGPLAAEASDVDVPAPFWVSDPIPSTAPDAVVVEHLSDVGIGLVAATPEVVDPAEAPPRLSAASLAALTAASRDLAARHLPALAASSRQRVSRSTALHPSSWRMPDLGTFPTLDADARRRLALLAGGSVAAGLACGLAVPGAAEATPAPHGTVPTGTAPTTAFPGLVGPSLFAGADAATPDPGAVVLADPAAPATPAPAAPSTATPAAAKPPTAKPTTAKPSTAKPTTAKPTAATPAAPAPTTSAVPVAPSGSGSGTTAVVAALLGPVATPFADAPAPASPEPVPPGTPEPATAPSSAPSAPSAPAASAPAASPASLPGRTATATAAVVVVADPVPPRPGDRPAPVVPAKPAWKPTKPLPAHSGTGRRIVYAERTAHLWIVGADGTVLRDYKVTGRADRPRPGTYHVFSKSRTTSNPKEKLTFDLMVRFTHGVTGAPIGFHTIPKTYSGHPIQSEKDLGRAIGMGGCVRQSRADAEWLYAWSRVGDTVVVLH